MFPLYGGLPTLPSEGTKGTPLVREVLTERQLQERAIEAEQERKLDRLVVGRLWERRSELGNLDLHEATLEVLRRFGPKMHQELKRLREDRELEMELDPPHRYYIGLDESAAIDERRKAIEAVAAHQKGRPSVGRSRRDQVEAVTAAILKDELGWSQGEIAELYGWHDETLVK